MIIVTKQKDAFKRLGSMPAMERYAHPTCLQWELAQYEALAQYVALGHNQKLG